MEQNFPLIPIICNFRPTSQGTPKIWEWNSRKCLFHSLPQLRFLFEWKAPMDSSEAFLLQTAQSGDPIPNVQFYISCLSRVPPFSHFDFFFFVHPRFGVTLIKEGLGCHNIRSEIPDHNKYTWTANWKMYIVCGESKWWRFWYVLTLPAQFVGRGGGGFKKSFLDFGFT